MTKFNKFKVGAISLLAALSVGVAIAQIPSSYLPGKNDTIRMQSANGSAYDSNFYNSVAAAGPCAVTTPTLASGFGTNAVISHFSPNCTMAIAAGTTAAANGVIALPAAAHGWNCNGLDITSVNATIFETKETATTSNTVTIDGFASNAAAGNWVANDVIAETCSPY